MDESKKEIRIIEEPISAGQPTCPECECSKVFLIYIQQSDKIKLTLFCDNCGTLFYQIL